MVIFTVSILVKSSPVKRRIKTDRIQNAGTRIQNRRYASVGVIKKSRYRECHSGHDPESNPSQVVVPFWILNSLDFRNSKPPF
jgi:hypothetical protein